MALTSSDVVNQAVQLIGNNQPLVTGVAPTFDSSVAGKAAAQLYNLSVRAVGRQFGWDFSRNNFPLIATGNTPPMGFAYEYSYPSFTGIIAVEMYQLLPPFPLSDPNNPAPIDWTVGNAVVSGTQSKVIWTNLQNAIAIVNNNPSENLWDPLFQQAVVRLLASAMAMSIAGKPDIAAAMLESGSAFESIGETRRD
jgi:hypothetical protein